MKAIKFLKVFIFFLLLFGPYQLFSTFKQAYYYPFHELIFIDTTLGTYFRQFNSLKYNLTNNSLDTFQIILKNTDSVVGIEVLDFLNGVFKNNIYYLYYYRDGFYSNYSICNGKGELKLININNYEVHNRPRIDTIFFTYHHFFFDSKFHPIHTDTTLLPWSSILFRSEVNFRKYFWASYSYDTTNLKGYFRFRVFGESQETCSMELLFDTLFIDSFILPQPFIGTFESMFHWPTIEVIRNKNGKDWWIIVISGAGRKYQKEFIRVFQFIDNKDGNFSFNTVPTYVDSLSINPFAHFSGLAVSPKGDLLALLYYNEAEVLIYLLGFDKTNGFFKSRSPGTILSDSYVSLKWRSIPNFRYIHKGTDIFPYYNKKNFWFSIDGKKLLFDKFMLDISYSSLDSIKQSFVQFLPNYLTSLEFYSRLGVKDVNKLGDYFIPNRIGSNGSIFDYMYFPYFNSKIYLYTLSFLDSLSQPISLYRNDIHPINRVPAYFDYILRSYEIKYSKDSAKYIFLFLKADTLHFTHLLYDTLYHRPPDGTTFSLGTRFYDHIYLSSFKFYYEYLYPFTTLPFQLLGGGRFCESSSLFFKAIPEDRGKITSFRWFGPNGFEETGDSVVIPWAKPEHSGWYYCYASVGDTTYTDSVEVEIVPSPAIRFKRGLPVSVCNTDSVELEIDYPRAMCCDYFVLWSTGDTTKRVVIRGEGNYWVKVWNELGCWDSVDFEVKFNKPLNVRINANRDWICSNGDSLELVVESDGNSYVWNDGVSGNRRMIYSPGHYTVVASNDYGCVDSASILIREEVVVLKVDEKVDFGRVYIGESKDKNITIKNDGNSDVKIGRVKVFGNSYEVDASDVEEKVFGVGRGSSIKVRFTALELGSNNGEVVVSVDSPCVVDYRIGLSGIGKGKVVVWSPWDTLAALGWMNYCIPVYEKVIEGKEESEYRWSGSVLVSSKLLRSDDGVVEGMIRRKSGTGIELMRKNEERTLMTLCGDVMMSGRRYEPVELESFDFGEYVEVEMRNGRIQIVGICMPELSQIESFLGLAVRVGKKDNGDEVEIEVEGESEGQHRLRIYNILGNVVGEWTWDKMSKREKILIDVRPFGRGLFFIVVTNGEQIVRKRLVIY